MLCSKVGDELMLREIVDKYDDVCAEYTFQDFVCGENFLVPNSRYCFMSFHRYGIKLIPEVHFYIHCDLCQSKQRNVSKAVTRPSRSLDLVDSLLSMS
jgi:hypothetical protein